MVVWLQMRISACFTSSDSENEDEGDEEVEVEDVAMSLHHELKQVNLHLFDNNSDTPHTCYSQETDAQQAVIVAMFNAMVTFTVFAPLCPLLPLLSPCFAYTNLYANNWVEQQQEIGKSRIAREFLVQKPVKSFCTITVAFQIVVVIGISIDLQFAAGCIILLLVASHCCLLHHIATCCIISLAIVSHACCIRTLLVVPHCYLLHHITLATVHLTPLLHGEPY